MNKEWSWIAGGVMLAAVGILAAMLVKPIGMSTQFVVTDGIVANAVTGGNLVAKGDDGQYHSGNAYLDKSKGKYAKAVANPINYGYIFTISAILGVLVSIWMGNSPKPTEADKQAPEIWRKRFGNNVKKRYIHAFLGGFLVLFGARLAGGCTSGHMISGIAQLSISGFIFTIAMFGAAVGSALFLYRNVKA